MGKSDWSIKLMATTTPNFGWPVPTSTDLVKNGATAIEALGDAIDASMADLEGGTTGQVLAKASNADMDFAWVAQDDSNAIQNTIVDAKGDLIGATAADTPARLAVGTNGQVLTADSTASTGLAWATPSSGTAAFVGAYAYRTTDLTIAAATDTIITLPLEDFDTDAYHSTSTNTGRITIPTGKAGKYQFNAYAFLSTSPGAYARFRIYKNGSSVGLGLKDGTLQGIDGFGYLSAQGSIILNLAVGDYVEVGFFTQNSCTCAFAYLSAQFLGA
jgi:hypothetical protein